MAYARTYNEILTKPDPLITMMQKGNVLEVRTRYTFDIRHNPVLVDVDTNMDPFYGPTWMRLLVHCIETNVADPGIIMFGGYEVDPNDGTQTDYQFVSCTTSEYRLVTDLG
jgi:hypothetical protein